MHVSLALVHHANQYLITEGYANREGLAAVLGSSGAGSGLAHVLDLHARHNIPINLHISGTLLEAVAWHYPRFLNVIRDLLSAGLIELVGSSYGQNIMRFFGAEYNRRQLNEELLLYHVHLGAEPERVTTFWPPERVWETRRMAPVLRDARLLNNGYRYVIVDDRVLLSPRDLQMPRQEYDEKQVWSPDLFRMYEVEDGLGLIAFPIGSRLRRSIPPRDDEDWRQVRNELEALLVQSGDAEDNNLLAIYADDMEKAAGIGMWGADRPACYHEFLEWVASASWIQPVKLTEWAALNQPAGLRKIEIGTFEELARGFEAGEGYEKWYLSAEWAPYRAHFNWAEKRVRECAEAGADRMLLALAEKQLLVGNWETAWHTPSYGPHGDPNDHGRPSPWACALTSHSRHAAVTAEAAHWMRHKDGGVHVTLEDIDNDGESELVFRNNTLFAVVTPRWGGRVVALFCVSGEQGAMMAGNPCDDWHYMEELNRYPEAPRNHIGCFADVGFENENFTVLACETQDGVARALLRSAAGIAKEFELGANTHLTARYELARTLTPFATECGLSPDYLSLLRGGRTRMEPIRAPRLRGFAANGHAVFVALPEGQQVEWAEPYQSEFAHGGCVRVLSRETRFALDLGVRTADSATALDSISPQTPVEAYR